MIEEDEIPDDRNPLAFVVLSFVFAAVGVFLISIFLFIAVICFFIAFVWFVTGYAQWRRLKEEARGRRRF
ncbi:MAG: hypothetical protein ACFE7S_08495 [Candidatus Hodarchaeota archaeon]